MNVKLNIKDEIFERIQNEPMITISGSEAEYLELAHELPFKVEYHNSEIIVMSLASFWHENIIFNLSGILYNIISNSNDLRGVSSNAGIHLDRFEGGYYQPDMMIVKGMPEFKSGSTSIITNPIVLFEIHSPGTTRYDLESKLPEYKKFESLKEIVFIQQKKVLVSKFSRSDNADIWLNQDFDQLHDSFTLLGHTIKLADIYMKVDFS